MAKTLPYWMQQRNRFSSWEEPKDNFASWERSKNNTIADKIMNYLEKSVRPPVEKPRPLPPATDYPYLTQPVGGPQPLPGTEPISGPFAEPPPTPINIDPITQLEPYSTEPSPRDDYPYSTQPVGGPIGFDDGGQIDYLTQPVDEPQPLPGRRKPARNKYNRSQRDGILERTTNWLGGGR